MALRIRRRRGQLELLVWNSHLRLCGVARIMSYISDSFFHPMKAMEAPMIETLRAIADEVEKAIQLIPEGTDIGEEICMGADGTPTSEIDKIAENTVLDYIQRHNVPLNVLSEEIGSVDNGDIDTLVLDPIDGTTNSIMGVPMFTISMAVGRNSLCGIEYALLRNLITHDEYVAVKGKGATLNGRPIHVKNTFDPKTAIMMVYLGYGAGQQSFALTKRVKTTRSYGCASLEMALVATGAADGFVMNSESYERSIRVVDIAASILILREAGGEALGPDGKPLDMPFDLEHRSNFIAFGNRAAYDYVNGVGGRTYDRPTGRPKYGIYANMSIPSVKDYAKRVMDALNGEEYVLDSHIAEALGMKGVPIDMMDADIIIAIGGDGTILRAFQNTDAMVVGVNAGDVGFLTEIEIDKISEGIRRLRNGDFTVQKRTRIQVSYNGEILGQALNEAVIHTDSVAKIRRFKVYVNDSLATDIRADGIMLSTPTGSTCYALSLGAPIIDSRVDAWVMVPMAAFKFSSRPMVIPTNTKVTVELVLDKGCLLVIDGQREFNLPGGAKVELVRAPTPASLIVFDPDFYSRIREKLVRAL
jgi:NAD+ kinase